jgi:hypothetical protein
MRATVIALIAVFGLGALAAPVRAAPAAPPDFAAPSATVMVRGGCGAGWHPENRRDRWGNWHRRCVPNRW